MATETTAELDSGGFRRRSSKTQNAPNLVVDENNQEQETKLGGIFRRLRGGSRSRSRSRSRSLARNEGSNASSAPSSKPILVAVTSCRSDAYYDQKAPGSTSKLPRKAPPNLKLFHELAVGVKDAYAAVNLTPERPEDDDSDVGKTVLWEFVGNLDFLLALVDEVATDTATRGALKDDTRFKSLRDVIKKGNRVLEGMLVRRERRHTLFFRLIQHTDARDISRVKSWNSKVDKAIGKVTDDGDDAGSVYSDADSSVASTSTDVSATSSQSTGGAAAIARGRQVLPTAGRVRARRATPTPTLRNHRQKQAPVEASSDSAEDGFSANTTAPVTNGTMDLLNQQPQENEKLVDADTPQLMPQYPAPKEELTPVAPIKPTDELIDVIKGLRTEKEQRKGGSYESELMQLKPNWRPKATIPSSVPKLPTEYIHRHRLMKQVVNSLVSDQSPEGNPAAQTKTSSLITSITSRHADKPGNGKTTLAVAAIQTVEVRERFSDGIAWIQLGRNPLNEKEVRRLYEELFRQLVSKGRGDDDEDDDEPLRPTGGSKIPKAGENGNTAAAPDTSLELAEKNNHAVRLAESRQRFQGGELDAIKEDLSSIITNRNVLICLDDVWRIEDAKWFIFDTRHGKSPPIISRRPDEDTQLPYRILITTRIPSLLGSGVVQEIFVRIFSEHEAVKLLLSSAGRRPYGGKQSAVFNQARIIVKGCGNSPMTIRLAGGMLRRYNRNWNLSSPVWKKLIQQSTLNLEEASRLRSFVNSVTRIVDLGFSTVQEMELRVSIRRCFITFAMAFRDNDWVLIGKGIPQAVILKLFSAVLDDNTDPLEILNALETMNLLQRARHGTTSNIGYSGGDDGARTSTFIENPSFVMQDSLRAIGEEVSRRFAPAFLPEIDDFTSFFQEILDEQAFHDRSGGDLGGAMRFIVKQFSSKDLMGSGGMHEKEVHELVAACLIDIEGRINKSLIVQAYRNTKDRNKRTKGGDRLEEYTSVFLPSHLIQSQSYSSAGELLVDGQFIRRRVKALGATEATRKQVADLLELRREVAKEPAKKTKGSQKRQSGKGKPNGTPESSVDTSLLLRDGCRTIVDQVARLISHQKGSAETLGMAICLSTVGEGLMKGKQPRDAIGRLEEALQMYRSLLGDNHVDVARSLHSVARALVKLGDSKAAIKKFGEAAEVYETCNATMHFDSIANSQNLATLYVDLQSWDKAEDQFNDLISKKKAVYGKGSVSVAKTFNGYAILLAKHQRIDQALANYEAAKATYEAISPSLLQDQDFVIKCKYDLTLINLNIASIRSKQGDLIGSIASYEDGVHGLREYAAAQERLVKAVGSQSESKDSPHLKHLVAALGRIGSLKIRIGDNPGALEAYQELFDEVDDFSSKTARIERAKGHIKVASVFRQSQGKQNQTRSIEHLREALKIYDDIHGSEHKDTKSIAESLHHWISEKVEGKKRPDP